MLFRVTITDPDSDPCRHQRRNELSNEISVAFHGKLVKHPPIKGTAPLVRAQAAVILLATHPEAFSTSQTEKQTRSYYMLSGF